MYMNPAKSLLTALVVCALFAGTADAGDKTSIFGSVAGSSPVSMLGRYTDLGLGGAVGIGLKPFRTSEDVEFFAVVTYDRFANKSSDMGAYSFVRFGGGIRLNLDASSPNRMYLLLALGPALVRVAENSGYPPFGSAKRSTTNLYGAGGFGYEFGVGKPVSMFFEAELVDILDTLFGDYRFLRLGLGLRL